MTTLKKIISICFWITVLFSVNFCCSSKKRTSYLKSSVIQNIIDKAIINVIENESNLDYITVYFTESISGTYIFVTPRISVHNISSKYYFEKDNKWVIIGYNNKKTEETFADLKSSRLEKKFNHTDREIDIYDGRQIIFEVLNNNSIKEINPNEDILELNDYGMIKFIPPVKK